MCVLAQDRVAVQPSPCSAGSKDGGGLPRRPASPAATRKSSRRRPCCRQEATTVSTRSTNRLPALLSELKLRFAGLFKSHVRPLIRGGEIDWDTMRKTSMSKEDLLAALRLQAKLRDVGDIEAACLERNGDISVIPRGGEPRVIEVTVHAGVQTVRIELR